MAVDVEALKRRALEQVDAFRPELERLSCLIHDHPELPYQERQAVTWLCDALEANGFRVQRAVGGIETAFLAEASASRDGGPTIALCAEYDALEGLGHGCGHNLVGVAAVGAALGAAPVLEWYPGRIRVYGTPAEEGGFGKVRMLEAGLFEGVDVVMMFHPHNLPHHVTRQCMAATGVTVRFRGKAAHAAAAPWEGINALDAMILLFQSIGLLRQQLRPSARIHGIITNGGQAFNVIPELSEARLGVRSLESKELHGLLDRLDAMARGAAAATGCRVEVEREPSMESHRYNEPLCQLVEANLASLGESLAEVGPMLASTDFGNLTQVMPGVSLKTNCFPREHPAHSRAWVELGTSQQAHDGMMLAAHALALTCIDLLADPRLLGPIREDFDARA